MYDLVIVGGGSAGVTAAKFGAQLGAKVAVIEANKMGGDCTWTGCVPSKALIHVARAAHTIRTAERYGIAVEQPQIDFGAVIDHIHAIQNDVYEHDDAPEVIERTGAHVIKGHARFRDAETLDVDGRTVRAKHYCIATGSHANIPPAAGLSEVGYLTSENVFLNREFPRRLLVVGGGPIGCELGQSFARLGADVTIVQSGERLLPKDDADMGPALQRQLEADGITIHLNAKATSFARTDGGKQATLTHKDGSTSTLEVDQVLVSAGRSPAVKELGLDVAGVNYDARRGIAVDEYLRTANPRIYACGDVIGRYQFTHMAAAEAGLILRNALFPGRSKMNYDFVPWATFTDPEVAHIGLNEDAARDKHGAALRVYRLPWRNNDRARTEDATEGLIKILAVGLRERIVGAHIIGAEAGELIHPLMLAMQNGIKASSIGSMIHIYPTRALGVKNAAQQSLTRRLDGGLAHTLLRTYFKLFGA